MARAENGSGKKVAAKFDNVFPFAKLRYLGFPAARVVPRAEGAGAGLIGVGVGTSRGSAKKIFIFEVWTLRFLTFSGVLRPAKLVQL